MKKFLISIGVVGLVAVVAGIWTSASAAVLGQNDRNCTSTAVIICGAFKQSELDSRMTDSARAIFKDMGISTNLSAAQNGIVRANGNVELANGKVVATGVQVIGAGPTEVVISSSPATKDNIFSANTLPMRHFAAMMQKHSYFSTQMAHLKTPSSRSVEIQS